MSNLQNKKRFTKNIIVLSIGLALSACGGSSNDDKVVDVVNSAPTISSTAVTTVESGTAYSYSLVAADADGDTLTMTAANLPAWLTFDSATGTLSGTPADSDEGDTAITLTVSDGTDEITQSFTVSVTVPVPPNNAAVITSTGVTTATVGEAYSYTLMATDADSDTLTMSTTIPAALSWLTFDAATGILSGTPASGDIAATEITLTVNDGTEDTMQMFTITVAAAAVVPTVDVISFENAPETYSFGDFDGGAASVVANPDAAGINTSAQVGKMVKSAGQTWGGSTMTLATPVAIPADSMVTMMVWASRAVPVLVKFDDMNAERTVNHTGSGWEELTFDFTGDVSTNETRLTLIFDNGVMGDAAGNADNWTFYFDDFTTPKAEDVVVVVPVGPASVTDFEAAPSTYLFGDFDGGEATVIANPDVSGINTSAQVGQMTKSAGQTWGGSTMTLAAPAIIPANSMVTLKVWSSRAVPVLAKFDDMNAERTTNHTGSGWEELSFDFTGATSAGETRLTLIFDNGTMGDFAGDPANWTFYFDDFTTPAEGEVAVPVTSVTDFEAATDTYVFSDFDGGAAAIITNPDPTGINTSAQVGEMTKSAGQTWGGSTMTLATPVVMSANSMVTMKVWASRAVPVLVKFDDMNAEKTASHTGSGWEELSFDFAGSNSTGETKLTLIFDNGVMGDFAGDAANWTFYFDDFTTISAAEPAGPTGGIADIGDTGLVVNGGFELGNLDIWGGTSDFISVEMDDLGTYLTKIVAPEAQSPGIRQSKIGEGIITAGQALTVSFDMKGTAAGDGGVVNALLFTEASSGVSKTETLFSGTPSADWTSHTFDVTAGDDTEWGVALLLQPACGAVAGCEVTAYFDNVKIVAK